jgi:hypothetical protein
MGAGDGPREGRRETSRNQESNQLAPRRDRIPRGPRSRLRCRERGPLVKRLLFFLLVFILAAVFNPVVSCLQRWHIPRALGALSLVLLLLASLAVLSWLVLPPLLEELGQFFTRLSKHWRAI